MRIDREEMRPNPHESKLSLENNFDTKTFFYPWLKQKWVKAR